MPLKTVSQANSPRTPDGLMTTKKLMLAILAIISVFIASTKYDIITAEHTILESKNTTHMKSIAVMDSDLEHSGLLLKNPSLSPLYIKSVYIYDYAGNPIQNTSYGLKKHSGLLSGNHFEVTPLQAKDTIDAGGEHWLIRSYHNSSKEAVMVRDFLEQTSIEICYCSLTDKCSSKTVGLIHHPTSQC